MSHTSVFAAIDALADVYVDFWEDACNIESPTLYKEGVDAVGAYFMKKAKERGWKIEVFEQSVSGNAICITMNPEAQGAPIALSGHMDTVHAVGSFGSPAVRVDRENDRIYGPGVTDCKGGAVAAFLAMDALQACSYQDRPVMLLLQSDEENGSKTSGKQTIGWICEKAKDCVAFLNAEGYKEGSLVVGRKGILRYRFDVVGEAVHSADCANGIGGINAIAEAAHKILELEKLKDRYGITCNCGLIEGGTVANTVPDRCSFVADIRCANEEQLQKAAQKVQEVADRAYLQGAHCTVERISYRVAMDPSNAKNQELFCQLNRCFAQAGLPVLEHRISNGGSDAADATVAGIPTVDSIGVAGGRIHSVEEFAYLSSLPLAAKRMAAAILYL